MSLARIGVTPWNKGITGYMGSNSTSFKKGIIPHNKGKKTTREKVCLSCNEKFIAKKNIAKYCSFKCTGDSKLGKKRDEVTRIKIGLAGRGRPSPRKGKSLEWMIGGKNHRWVENRTRAIEKHRMRGSIEWKEWRASVFARDNFTCKECGVSGVYVEPHHIVPLKSDFGLAYQITNGITLCRPCHKKTMWKEDLFKDRYLNLVAKL